MGPSPTVGTFRCMSFWISILFVTSTITSAVTSNNSTTLTPPGSREPTQISLGQRLQDKYRQQNKYRVLSGHSGGIYRNEAVPQASTVLCPTDKCICSSLDQNRYNIYCRQLSAIPRFSNTGISYYQLTFRYSTGITTLPVNAFSSLKIERIDLLTNRLSVIESGAFTGIGTSLKELYIQGNGKIPVPFEKMTNLVQIRSLHVKSFRQSTISKDNHFGYFPNLEILHMEDIKDLSSIDSQAFTNKLRKLKNLRLREVDLNQLPASALSQLQQLEQLFIEGTNIIKIYDRSFTELNNLRELDLSYNKVKEIQNNAFEDISQHLTSLILNNNKLTQSCLISISSKPWNQLQTLSLSYNSDLRGLPDGLFDNMPQLQYLNLVEVNLQTVSGTMFHGLADLHILDLSWNKIESIADKPFKQMSKLQHLRLDNQFNNGVDRHPSPGSKTRFSSKSFNGIQESLKILELDKTPIIADQFWQIIPTLTHLKELSMSQTGVSYIPDYIFEKNNNLETLALEENNVTITSASFKGLEKSLKKLFLSYNELKTISECTFHDFTALSFLFLYGNPLQCDCNMTWLRHFIHDNDIKQNFYDENNYICGSPSQFKGKYFYNVTATELSCSLTPTECVFTKKPTEGTTITTKSPNLSTTTISTSLVTVSFTLTGITTNSITVAWSVSNKQHVTGYRIDYFPTSRKTDTITAPIHRDYYTFTVRDLQAATFYKVCITPEIDNTLDVKAKSCQTEQTKVVTSNQGGQTGENHNTTGGLNLSRNVIIGICLASIVGFILIMTGICMVVKYKMQKLKVIEWSIGRQLQQQTGASCEDGLDKGFGAIPNDYMEIDSTRLIRSPKRKRKQDKDLQEDSLYKLKTKYSSCKKVQKKRNNPYENENDPEEEIPDCNDTSDKTELEIRHSAPSRLEAKDLLNYNPRLSRPLPATPTKINQSKTLDRRSHKPDKDTNMARVFVTQVSVYDNRTIPETSEPHTKPSVPSKSSIKDNEIINESEKDDEITK